MPNTYSGSIDLDRVLPVLQGRIGWAGDATAPASGRYFDDGSFHALVTQANIRATQPNAALTNEQFDSLKVALKKAAIMQALSLVFPEPDFIERGMALIPTRYPKQAMNGVQGFQGFEINTCPSEDYVLKLNQAVLDFSAASTFKLYLFREGETTALWEQQVTAAAGQLTVVDLTDCYLGYGLHRTMAYYFGYLTSELDNGAVPNGVPVDMHCFTMALFSIASTPTLPASYQSVDYPSRSLGLNVECSVLRDHSLLMVHSPQVMDNLVGLVMAHMVLEGSVFSARLNTTGQAIKENVMQFAAQFDLMGSIPASGAPTVESIRSRIKREVAQVRSIFSRSKKGVIEL